MNMKDILLIIIFIYVIYLHSKINTINNIETFAVTDDIIAAVKQVYNTDMEAVRQLAIMSDKIQKEGLDLYLPKGTIVAYNLSNAPKGWTLCDGSNGSPDLRNKFILGGGYRGVGTTGGEENVALTEGQMPQHYHSVTSTGNLNLRSYTGRFITYTNDGFTVPDTYGATYRSLDKWGDISVYGNTDYKGGNQAHNNMPPYYVLTYIMKI